MTLRIGIVGGLMIAVGYKAKSIFEDIEKNGIENNCK